MDSAPSNTAQANTNTPPTVPAPPPSSNPPSVQQLHQGNLEMQRQLLQQKLAEKANGNFTSPTDQMMTPVSKKLSDHKKKAFGKTKPMSLASRFAKEKGESQRQQQEKPQSRFAQPSELPEGAAPNVDPFANPFAK